MGFETAVFYKMKDAFNKDELNSLCFELQLDWENLSDSNKKNQRIQGIIQYMIRHRKTDVLISTLRKERPRYEWPDPPTKSEIAYGKTDAELDKAINNYLESLRQEVGYVRILGRMQREPLGRIFTHVNILRLV